MKVRVSHGKCVTHDLLRLLAAVTLSAAFGATALGSGPESESSDDMNPPWTAGEGRVTMSDQTMGEARDQARNLARKDALERATDSFLLRVSDDYVKQETGGSQFERFSKSIRRETSGRIIDERNVDFTQDEPAPDVFQVICRLEARIGVEKQERNSAFAVRVDLHNSDSGVYRIGEEMILRISASLDCWVTVFNVYADGTVAVLLPNARMPNNRVVAGTPFVVPDHRDPEQDSVYFRLGVPEGQSQTEEYIAVVATLREYPFLSNRMSDWGVRYVSTYESAFNELNDWILRIPASERAEAEVIYSIIR